MLSNLLLHTFRSLLEINTYNEKRKNKYCHRFFIGCEDIILKSLRDSCKVRTHLAVSVIVGEEMQPRFFVWNYGTASAFEAKIL